MSDGGAKVDSIDAIRQFRVALIKFAESANAALSDAEADATRTLIWLEHDQVGYWKDQLKKRHAVVERCKEALRMKRLFKDSAGRQQSAVDEEKALKLAVARFEEAGQKAAATKKAVGLLTRQLMMYKGSVQRMNTAAVADVPAAAASLAGIVAQLSEYVNLRAPDEAVSQATGDAGPSMARPDDDAPETPHPSRSEGPGPAPESTPAHDPAASSE
ncbi:MAG TPA: hypothetical protein VK324_08080 [Tepidisphaeraceae bacterium]|nr:hypothetical protein [Tepidisphaeraceae bacterium]